MTDVTGIGVYRVYGQQWKRLQRNGSGSHSAVRGPDAVASSSGPPLQSRCMACFAALKYNWRLVPREPRPVEPKGGK